MNFILFWNKSWNYNNLLNFLYIYILIKNIKSFYKNQYKFIIFYKLTYVILQSRLDFLSQHLTYIDIILKLFIKIFLLILLNNILFKNNIYKINKFLINLKAYKNLSFTILIINYININSILIFYKMMNKNIYIFKNMLNIINNILYIFIIFLCKIFITKKKFIIINKINIIFNIITGNYIYNNNKDIYNIYIICGKLYNIKLIKEQQIIGLLLWLMTNMMSLILYKNLL